VRERDSQTGQASVELVAMLPVVALVALLLWQLAVAGQAAWLASSAARAAARAHAVGADASAGARSVLPARLESGLRVRTTRGGSVSVSLNVPTVVGRRRLATIGARAQFEPQNQ